MRQRVLISGASIAGNTAAWWLGRYGFDVTVIERATQFRDGGQNIDVRGVGREVLRRMHLEQAALDQNTGEKGTAWIDRRGRVAAQITTSSLHADGPTAEMEILRGDLARLLYDSARMHASYRFGESIAQVVEHSDNVEVSLSTGLKERFDAVIIAEGVGSAMREIILPGANNPRWMDLTLAYFTIPRTSTDDPTWRWYNATEGRSIHLRPDRYGTTRAMLSLQQPPHGEQDWTVERQKTYLRERFADAGWQAERVLAGMAETDDFYFEVLRQVRMKRWSQGRVAFTGDAAWCATPLAGIGTTLAIAGSYVLAGEMQCAQDLRAAFQAYEAQMRPMVNDAQGIPKIAPRMMNPHTRVGISLLHTFLRLVSKPMFQNVASRLFTRKPKSPDLSRYPAIESAESFA